MNIADVNRLTIVRDLLTLAGPPSEILAQLATLDWDYDGVSAALTTAHLKSALTRYLNGELTTDEIESWANGIEGRDDIHFEAGDEARIDHAIHTLANPRLTQPLDQACAMQLLAALA